jgi:hypothetical protein
MSDYLFKCRENYFNGITPSNEKSKNTVGYQELLKIANDTIEKIGLEAFTGFFQELQYRVNLWTAHIILEHYNADIEIEKECIKIIKRYSTGTLNPIVAIEEKKWLEENKDKYSNSTKYG